LQSPVVLERSGIGRREVLEKANIPLKLELPGVGENLQEHVITVAVWGTVKFFIAVCY
jgi:choline dehydrogenase-like flavoprotein